MAIIKQTDNIKCRQGCGETVPSHTVGGNVNWSNHFRKTMWQFLERLNIVTI